MQGTRPASETGLPPKRRRTRTPDSITLASVVLASAVVAPITTVSAFQDWRRARRVLGEVIERLLGVLDTLDGDPDLEPSLGGGPADARPGLLDIEGDDADDELTGDENEPSLGSFDRMTNQEKSYRQTANWFSGGDDRELDRSDNEEGGDRELNGDEADYNYCL